MQCDTECLDTCHQPKDPKACDNRCKNVKHFYSDDKFECLKVCPAGYEPIPDTVHNQVKCHPCKPGYSKDYECKLFILIFSKKLTISNWFK